MTIDPTKPVILKKQIVSPAGNTWDPRPKPYQPGEIPADFLTDAYCSQDGIIAKLTPVVTPPTILADPSTSEQAKTLTASTMEQVELVKVNINSASPEEISAALDGVGAGTAAKIVTMRAGTPFADISDLKGRVPLKFGLSWEKFVEQLEF